MSKINPKLKNIFLIGFLLSLHLALVSYINSSFLSSFLGEKDISFIYILGSLASILMLFLVPQILRKTGSYKFLLLVGVLNTVSLFLLSILKNSTSIILIFIFYFTLNNLIIFLIDELLQIFSKNNSMGKTRGLYLTCVNIAWVISQTISGKILGGINFSILYFISFLIMVVFSFASFFSFRKIPDPKYDKAPVWKTMRNFFKNKNLIRSYKINFLLQFFYSWMVIYTPIYLYAHLGFNWKEIGIIFAIMLIPFVLLQYPLGKYSDKIGERKMLMFGFTIASLATMSLFFIKEHSIWIWAILLFTTRIGAATIEVMSDVYFFKHITAENDEFIGVYRNAGPMSYVLSPIVAFVIFSLLPTFNFIFIILGILMLYGIYLSSMIRRSDI